MADKVYTSAEFKRERDNFHVSHFYTNCKIDNKKQKTEKLPINFKISPFLNLNTSFNKPISTTFIKIINTGEVNCVHIFFIVLHDF